MEWATAAQLAFLAGSRIGHLATVDGRARPHVVPICFAVLDTCIYSALDEKPKQVSVDRLRRVLDITTNPAVCLVVDRYSEDWSKLAWVQVRATANLVSAHEVDHNRAVAALRARYAQYRTMRLEERPLLRLIPNRVVSWGV
ncbi:MAG: TIGR03668 family PPOX class F420-dependent oxidoreductase [Dehalococcoidia bacterium]